MREAWARNNETGDEIDLRDDEAWQTTLPGEA